MDAAAGTLPHTVSAVPPVKIAQNSTDDLIQLYEIGQQQAANGQVPEALATFDRV